MMDKFIETIRKHDLIQAEDGIVVGVSGGPDSISLLHLLWRIRQEYSLKLYVVHLNHRFRGIDADKDSEYVKDFSARLGIPAYIYSEDVTTYAKTMGMSAEEAGRELRYKYFYDVLRLNNASKIAVAQNKNDQAETVLMRLMRGAGIEGLSAIEYKRNNTIIRPLLDIEREEIERYCIDHNLDPRLDKTNLESIYSRNRVRLELIPYIEKYFNPNIKATLCRTAQLMSEDSDFINQMVDESYNKTVIERNGEIRLNRNSMQCLHTALAKRVLRKGIKAIAGGLKDVESKHIELLMELITEGRTGAEINLPNQVIGLLEYETLILRYNKDYTIEDFEYRAKVGEQIYLKELKGYVITRILEIEDIKDIPTHPYVKYFDFGKLQKGITIRNRRNGDVFTPLGMKGHKKLKDFFIDEKIPRSKRNEIPLICDGQEIIWIIGYRISNKYKIDSETRKVLEIEYKKDSVEDF